jgi:hypothetical protein
MLRRLWERWKVLAQKIGTFQSRVLLTIFYYLILAPFGLGVNLLSDRLRLKQQHRSHWLPKESNPASSWDSARRQF